MTAHAIVTAIEDEARALARLRVTGRQDVDLAERDEHCQRVLRLIRQLRPLIGTTEPQSFGTGGRSEKGRAFTVVRQRRARRGALSAA